MALVNYFNQGQVGASQPVQQVQAPTSFQPATGIVQTSLEAMLNPNSTYIQNARQRGMEVAATRGGINSSIAAGAAERQAIEAAAPLAQQAINIQQSREGAIMQEWMAQQGFGRNLINQKFGSTLDMLNNIQQMAMMDPELYTPEVTSGLTNFFQKNMNDVIKRYLSG